MIGSIIIRQEAAHDYNEIGQLVKLAFNNVEESNHKEHLLVEHLRLSDAYIPELSLVAETNNQKIIGHIMLSKIKIIGTKSYYPALAVAPLSVLPEHQKMGIGKMLLQEAHKRAAQLCFGAALLLGHKDYYPRFGYKKASSFGITFPFEAPDEYCMVKELKTGSLKGIHGVVQYPDVFFID